MARTGNTIGIPKREKDMFAGVWINDMIIFKFDKEENNYEWRIF